MSYKYGTLLDLCCFSDPPPEVSALSFFPFFCIYRFRPINTPPLIYPSIRVRTLCAPASAASEPFLSALKMGEEKRAASILTPKNLVPQFPDVRESTLARESILLFLRNQFVCKGSWVLGNSCMLRWKARLHRGFG